MTATIRLQREPLYGASEAAKLRRGRGDIGAVVTFTGICRSDENGAPLVALTLEHYPDMAEAEIARHVEAAAVPPDAQSLPRHVGSQDRPPRGGSRAALAAARRHRHPPSRAADARRRH